MAKVIPLITETKDRRKPKGKVPKYRLEIAISEMEKGGILALDNKNVNFLLDIIKLLPEEATLESSHSFNSLAKALWKKLSSKWGKEFNKADCHNALSVLESKTDVLDRHEEAQRRFYVFNSDSEFLNRIRL